jgi:hypothetical protein
MKHLIDTAADLGVESVVMGMPHRGAGPFRHPASPPMDEALAEHEYA